MKKRRERGRKSESELRRECDVCVWMTDLNERKSRQHKIPHKLFFIFILILFFIFLLALHTAIYAKS